MTRGSWFTDCLDLRCYWRLQTCRVQQRHSSFNFDLTFPLCSFYISLFLQDHYVVQQKTFKNKTLKVETAFLCCWYLVASCWMLVHNLEFYLTRIYIFEGSKLEKWFLVSLIHLENLKKINTSDKASQSLLFFCFESHKQIYFEYKYMNSYELVFVTGHKG